LDIVCELSASLERTSVSLLFAENEKRLCLWFSITNPHDQIEKKQGKKRKQGLTAFQAVHYRLVKNLIPAYPVRLKLRPARYC
jgi:hypothetical protein